MDSRQVERLKLLAECMRSLGVEYYREGGLEIKLLPQYIAEPPRIMTPDEMKREAERLQKEHDDTLYAAGAG